jgi:hypothetical protein
LHQAQSIVSLDADAQNPTRDLPVRGNVGLWLAVACALGLSLFLQQSRLLTVWRGGGFFDTDDAMRMVQVRDLLAGQGWYDMTQWRLDAPRGVFMHWSRIVDIPLVLLLKFFGLFLAPEQAERAARIAFPTLIFAVLLSGGAWAARIFAGASARVYGVFAILFCGVFFWQFPPGRIDHHAPQITLLFFAVAALARAFDPAEARWAVLAGACVAISLGIGLENLPLFAPVFAAPGIAYLLRGEAAKGLLRAFAAGLAPTLTLVYLLTIGPPRWLLPACDALSTPWFAAALAGAAFYALLSFVPARGWRVRLAAVAGAGAMAVAPLLLIGPNCLRAPYAEVDPLLKKIWIDHIAENLSLAQNYVVAPGAAFLLAVPILIGLAGAGFGAVTSRGVARARWLLLLAVGGVGFAAACLCLRVFSSIMPLAALGLLAPVMGAQRALAGSSSLLASAAGFGLLLALSSFGVALALPEMDRSAGAELSPDMAWRRPDPCLESESYSPLAELSPGLAVAPIQSGAYLLAHTRLSVLAAGYHRASRGNRAAIDILRAEPALAESLARKAGAKYVLLCWAAPADLAWWKALAPEGLAAQAIQGRVPAWLRPLSAPDAPVHAYEILPPNS